MVKYEDECVGCPKEMGCLGSGCPNRNVLYLICDRCDCDAERLYDVDGEQLCEDCVLDMYDVIDADNAEEYV